MSRTSEIAPDWQWTDIFGDTLEVREAGTGLVFTIATKVEAVSSDQAAILLDADQLRGLRAAIGVHLRGVGR